MHISSFFPFALLDLDPGGELPGSWGQFLGTEAACFPAPVRAACQQLAPLTSHLLLPAFLSLLSSTFFFFLFPTLPLQINHICMHKCHTNYMLADTRSMGGRGKSCSKTYVAVKCIHNLTQSSASLDLPGRRHLCCPFLPHFVFPLVQRIPPGCTGFQRRIFRTTRFFQQ